MATFGTPHSFYSFQLDDGSYVNVEIIDTPGQEAFRSLCAPYYNKVDGILLVYDITYRTSFDEIKDYYSEKIKDSCKENVKVILLGNKTDLEKERKISLEDGANLAAEKGFMFMETSCLKNEYVTDCFETLIDLVYKEKRQNEYNDFNNYEDFKELYKYLNF